MYSRDLNINHSLLKSNNVPCGSCFLCCIGDAIMLMPEDNPDLYKTVKHEYRTNQLMLDHQENGDCIYLDRVNGCTIHPHFWFINRWTLGWIWRTRSFNNETYFIVAEQYYTGYVLIREQINKGKLNRFGNKEKT